ncbi:hypothetical protein TNCV_4966441 [Trichonephila clavipes]|nr:hypothetical protein TNCV_4966441 [Trichonephila clavipes]
MFLVNWAMGVKDCTSWMKRPKLYCSQHSDEGPRVTHTSSMEQNVLDSIRRNPSTSVRAVTSAEGGSRNIVHRVLQREGYRTAVLNLWPTEPFLSGPVTVDC